MDKKKILRLNGSGTKTILNAAGLPAAKTLTKEMEEILEGVSDVSFNLGFDTACEALVATFNTAIAVHGDDKIEISKVVLVIQEAMKLAEQTRKNNQE